MTQTTKPKVEKVKRNCQTCGNEMLVYQSEIKAGVKGKFCSHSCAAKNRARRSLWLYDDNSTDFLSGDYS